MSINAPYPDLDELTAWIGEAGRRLSEIGASEGAAGNISVYLGWRPEARRRFSNVETIELPLPVPELARGCLLVTGSGRRLREAIQNPAANLGFVAIDEGGRTGRLAHVAPASVRPPDQRAQFAPGGPSGPGPRHRDQFPRRCPRPARIADVLKPYPGLP